MWVKLLQTDVLVLVCTIAFILWAEEHWNRKVPERVKRWGGAALLLSALSFPVIVMGIIWS